MYFITIDCGTTNSRAYVVDGTGSIISKASKGVGVRNTSMTGSKKVLEDGLHEILTEAIAKSGIGLTEIKAIISSGMITSEIGLYEIPHLMAPCGVDELAAGLTRVEGLSLSDEGIPVYFVRGIKNAMPENAEDPFSLVGELDFMRGEETQMAGLIAKGGITAPTTVVVLSSHTKFIPIDGTGRILGSLTTTSGQIHEAVIKETFVGKSVEKRENKEDKPADYFDPAIVENAAKWINKGGIVRCLMLPRFLDVLLDTKWYERELFYEALIAAEDMLAIGQLGQFDPACNGNFVFIGLPGRCRLYEYIVKQRFPKASIRSITDRREIDELSIRGTLEIARKAGVFHE